MPDENVRPGSVAYTVQQTRTYAHGNKEGSTSIVKYVSKGSYKMVVLDGRTGERNEVREERLVAMDGRYAQMWVRPILHTQNINNVGWGVGRGRG